CWPSFSWRGEPGSTTRCGPACRGSTAISGSRGSRRPARASGASSGGRWSVPRTGWAPARASGSPPRRTPSSPWALLRGRQAGGELAEIFGPVAVKLDRRHRVHRFRALAERIVASSPPQERALLAAYTDGVNAGLSSLGGKPFEYLALRVDPAPWRPEDSIL